MTAVGLVSSSKDPDPETTVQSPVVIIGALPDN